MASGSGDVGDLIFNFLIPRSADPLVVFESLANAVEYPRNRLGGTVVLRTGKSFDKQAERKKIQRIVEKLDEAGFAPGDSPRIF